MKKPIEGAKIVTYGHEVTIAQVVTVGGKDRVYLDRPILVPWEVFPRDYISSNEIERYVDF